MSKLLGYSALQQFSILVFILLFTSNAAFSAGKLDSINKGKKLTIKLCQACHSFNGAQQAGTVAPVFISMKARFPQRKKLFNIIYNPQSAIKYTMMPPFGKHEFLTTQEINNVIDFLYTQ